MKFSISSAVTASGILLALGIVLALTMDMRTLQHLKVNGPVYNQIVDSKDLIADILPPPLYVVEAYSLVSEAALHPDTVAHNVERLSVLRGQYQERREYWKTSTLPDSIKQKLQSDVLVKGDAFWAILDGIDLHTLAGRDVSTVITPLKIAFHVHETAVNELVAMGDAYGKQKESEAADVSKRLETMSYALGGALILLSLGSLLFVRRRALRPLRSITTAMTTMAMGDLQKEPPYLNRHDEIGDIAKALAVFRNAGLEKRQMEEDAELSRAAANEQRRVREHERMVEADTLRSVVEELGAGLNCLADCNMRMTIDNPFDPRFEGLRTDFNKTIAIFRATLEKVQTETVHLQTNSREMRDASDNLARRTEQQAAALEQTAAALEQVASTVATSVNRTRETRNLVKEARQSATASSGVVKDAVTAMERIEAASSEIGSIISVIDEIAFQTNLLALNAGVEAARAGEAGKGFAVVAQEVRELAQRSAGAARQIKGLIERSGQEVATGVQLVGATGSALEQIGQFVAQIDENVDRMSSVAEEQASGLQQISSSVHSLDQMTQQNAAMVEETNAISQTIADGAVTLTVLINRFQLPGSEKHQPPSHHRAA
ncbi:methyl-accepting chemotaxis protein [Rhizobium oryziradicis]|uniref:Chemotaxis protein n=1 Tax=Rhizobium oryziradicis TaxID=1867956 RepID=A0A1Q8ZXL5_9HYPH|nr:HAMP domain-containing methyl-accepting chemotaxis protein [Rhizobium oryziradicis]OLP46663.1 chemotaxis protein [Rhizobium oryziradicis]